MANFIGVANLFEGNLSDRKGENAKAKIDFGGALGVKELLANDVSTISSNSKIHLCIRPEDMELSTTKFTGELAKNSIAGKVIETVYLGNFLECRVKIGNYEMIIQLDHFEQLKKDQAVNVSFKAAHGLLLPD